LFACSKSDQQPISVMNEGSELFEATFVGNYTFVGADPENCGIDKIRKIIDGKGTSTPLENSVVHLELCCCTEGYGSSNCYLLTDEGEMLYVSLEGKLIQGRSDEHPDYVTSYWKDQFRILGGTGRFERATGGGITDDYNSSLDPYSHHHWTGTITLVKGKK